jgi:hypothetical protein
LGTPQNLLKQTLPTLHAPYPKFDVQAILLLGILKGTTLRLFLDLRAI